MPSAGNRNGWAPEQRHIKSHVTEVDKKARTTVGVLSTDGVDRDNEVLDQDSLAKALEVFIERSGIVVYMHQWAAGIGRAVDMSRQKVAGGKSATLVKVQYGSGYSIPTYWGMSIPVDDIWAQIDQGILRTHSHAFNATVMEPTAGAGVGAGGQEPPRVLQVTDMFEISVVTVPAMPDAVFDVVKMAQKLGGPAMPPGAGAEWDAMLAEARQLVQELRALKNEQAVVAAINEARRALLG